MTRESDQMPNSTITVHARRLRVRAFAIGLAVLSLAILVSIAQAGKGVVGSFGSQGQAEGQLSNPRDVAVNLPGGDSNGVDGFVYVVDEDNHRIQVFDSDGEFEFMFGSGVGGGTGLERCAEDCQAGSADDEGRGGLDDPQGIDIRQSTGQVFVRDRDNRRVQVFNADGTFAYMFGGNVNLTVPGSLCPRPGFAGDVCKVGDTGTTPGFFGTSSTTSTGIAVDQATGVVYVADPGATANRRVQAFDVTAPAFNGLPRQVSEVQRLAVDAASGTFALTYAGQTTAPIAYDAPANGAGSVLEALEALSNIAPGDVTVSGGVGGPGAANPYAVTFTGALAGSNVVQMTADASGLDVGAGSATVTTTTQGGNGIIGGNGTGVGQFGSNQPIHLAISNGILYASDTTTQLECFDTALNAFCASGPVTDFTAPAATTALETDPASGSLLVGMGDQIEELDTTPLPATNTDDPHIAGSGLTPRGIAVSGDRIYLTSTSAGDHRVFVVDQTTAPEATIEPTAPTAHQATLSGEVDPNGSPTGYRFEYVDDQAFQATGWTNASRVPFGEDAQVGNGDSPVEVDERIANLTPNTLYRARLVAKQTYGAATAIAGGPNGITFTTPGLVPHISGTGSARTSAGVDVWARVTPNNSPTSYRFEYGTTTAYGNQTPARDTADQDTTELAAETLTGLAPNTTYHYRAIATNDDGTTHGPDRTFTTSTPPPPIQRGYELVSHRDMGGAYAQFPGLNDGRPVGEKHPASPSGERFIFETSPHVPGTPTTRATPKYIAERTDEDWRQEYVGAPGSEVDQADVDATSEDLSRVFMFVSGVGLMGGTLDDDDPGDLFDVYAREPDGSFTWVSRRDPAVDHPTVRFDAMSRDGRYAAFVETGPLLLSGPGGMPSEPVSILSDGTVADGDERPGLAISADGSRVVFGPPRSSPDEGNPLLWVRLRDEGRTVRANQPAPGVPDSQGDPTFELFADDGSAVLFKTPQRLAVDDGDAQSDLYRFDVDAEEVTLLSRAAPAAPSDGQANVCSSSYGVSGCEVSPVMASPDGSTAYFLSPEELDTGAVQGEPNLYAHHDGVTALVGVLDPQDAAGLNSLRDIEPHHRPARVTDTGERLVFQSRAKLTGYDNGGLVEVYVYDLGSDRIWCASCAGQAGLGPNAEALLRSHTRTDAPIFLGALGVRGRNVANDGDRVYFQTAERLSVDDVNGQMDVYEFDVSAERIALISSGQGSQGAFYFDNSTDGEDVFFGSNEFLVPPEQDLNSNSWKVFDAREGGGFPARLPDQGCAEGDCRGGATLVPGFDGPLTEGVGGGGDLRSRRVVLRVGVPGRLVLRRAARSGRVVVMVRRSRPGRIGVVARARLGGRVRRVASRRLRVRAAGRARVVLRLSRPARMALRRGRTLRVSVAVSSPGVRRQTAVLRLAGGRR